MYDCFGLGIDRDRKDERIELVLRSQNQDLKSVLGVEMFLVWALYLRAVSRGMNSRHCYIELLVEKLRCVYEQFVIDRPIERIGVTVKYVPKFEGTFVVN
jgi:hypothetical protein